MFLYQVTNNITGKKHVGQTIQSLKTRFKGHCKRKKDSRSFLTNAIFKYGKENFTIEPIYEILGNRPDLLNRLEKCFIEEFNTLAPHGYNLRTGGDHPVAHEITKALQRKPRGPQSEEHKNAIRDGILASEAHKKYTDRKRGTKLSEEHKRKIGLSNTGKSCPWIKEATQTERYRISCSLRENRKKGRTSSFNYETADKIREMYASGSYLQDDLAEMFGVRQSAISRIIHNVRWARAAESGKHV